MQRFSEKFDRRATDDAPSQAELAALFPQLSDFSLLSGGFSNTNYRVRLPSSGSTGSTVHTAHTAHAVLRLARDPAALAKEVAALRRIRERVPAPEVLDHGRDGERAWALLRWIDGVSMDRALEAGVDEREAHSLGRACGAALSAIHGVGFERAGFLDDTLQVVEPLEPVGRAYLNHTRDTLARPLPRARLGEPLAARLEALLRRRGSLLDDLPRTRQLIHADFNTKNLLVRRSSGGWELAAVLDWEFAHAGPPLADIGNFLRFDEEAPAGLAEAFREAYRSGGGLLRGERDMDRARLLDLAAVVSFLDGPEERPRSVATARAVITRALALLD